MTRGGPRTPGPGKTIGRPRSDAPRRETVPVEARFFPAEIQALDEARGKASRAGFVRQAALKAMKEKP